MARRKNKNEPIPEADAKKQKLVVPKAFKLKVTGADNQDLLPQVKQD